LTRTRPRLVDAVETTGPFAAALLAEGWSRRKATTASAPSTAALAISDRVEVAVRT
jgi:hypothetical protein